MSLQIPAPQDTAERGWMGLVKAVEHLAAAEDLSEIIAIVRQTARHVVDADGVCFILRDGERCYYVDESAIQPLWKGKRFAITDCIAGACMQNDQTIVVSDVFADPRVPQDAYRPTFVKSLVVVPVRTHEPIGALGFYWAHVRNFRENELALIDAWGRSTSAAMAAMQSREELAESKRRLSLALEAGGLGAWEIDLSTDEMVATPASKAIFGVAADATFTREDLLALVHPDDRDRAHQMLEYGSEGWLDDVYRLSSPDGERHIEMQGRLQLDVDGRPVRVTGVARDVTERYQAAERLEAMRMELLRAARLNDLGAMASALAHELNQPLAAGMNYLSAAERLLMKSPDQALVAISKAAAQLVRTKEIVQRIRGFVGQSQSTRQREDLETVCKEVLELSRAAIRYGNTSVSLTVQPELPKIEIDKVQIQQVLLNLLRNALEAMHDVSGRQMAITVSRTGEMVEVRVVDNGPGLAAEIAKNLFQPFHSTKEDGMGVGLSLCRKIVESHGGKLWHEAGHPGAVFCFSLPV